MGDVIHCRERDGKKIFKVWSTVVDSYITHELNEKQLAKFVKEEMKKAAIAQFEREFPDRLERAKTRGTSSLISSKVIDLKSDWQKEKRDAED